MAKYIVADELGTKYQFDIEGDSPTDQERTRMRSAIAKARQAKEPEQPAPTEDRDFSLVDPVISGAQGFASGLLSGSLGAIQAAGEAIGADTSQLATRPEYSVNVPYTGQLTVPAETTRSITAGEFDYSQGRYLPEGFEVPEQTQTQRMMGVSAVPEGDIFDEQGRRVVSPAAYLNQYLNEAQEETSAGFVTGDEALAAIRDGDPLPLARLVVEQGLASVPYMLGAVLTPGTTLASISGDIATERAANRSETARLEGKSAQEVLDAAKVTAKDIGVGALFGLPSFVGEQFATGRLMRGVSAAPTAARRVLGQTTLQAGTEAAQDTIQQLGERIGVADIDPGQLAQQAGLAALTGGAIGGVGQTGFEMLRPRTVQPELDIEPPAPAPAPEPVLPQPEPAPAPQVEADQFIEPVPPEEETKLLDEAEPAPPQPVAPQPEPQAAPEATPQPAVTPAVDVATDPEVTSEQFFEGYLNDLSSRTPTQGEGAQFSAQRAMSGADAQVLASMLGKSPEEVESLAPAQRRSYEQTLDMARQQGLLAYRNENGDEFVPEALELLREEAATRTQPLSDVEQVGLLSYRASIKRRLDALYDRVGRQDADEAAKNIERDLLQQAYKVQDGLARSGSEIGRALRFRRFIVNEAMDRVDAKVKAAVKKGAPLTDKEAKIVDKLWDRAEGIEEKAKSRLEPTKKRTEKAAEKVASAEQKLADAEAKADAIKTERKPSRSRVNAVKAQRNKARRDLGKANKEYDDALSDQVEVEQKLAEAQAIKNKSPEMATQSLVGKALNTAHGISIALNASLDNSALLRQGVYLAAGNPRAALEALPYALRMLPFSKKGRGAARRIQRKLLSENYQSLRDDAGLELTEVEGISNVEGDARQTAREEFYMSNFEMKEGRLRDLVEGVTVPSQNLYSTTLNHLRARNFDAGVKILAKQFGVKDINNIKEIREKVPIEDLKGLAELINVSSGRGDLIDKLAPGGNIRRFLQTFMFAPKYSFSRIDSVLKFFKYMLPETFGADVSPQALALIRKEMRNRVGLLAGITLAGTYGMSGSDDEVVNMVDPSNADFMKLKMGNIRFDLLGGVPSTVRYLLPIAFSPKDIADEDKSLLDVFDYDPLGRGIAQVTRNKMSPIAGAIYTVITGDDFIGRDISGEGTVARRAARKVAEEFESNPEEVEAVTALILSRIIFPASGLVAPIALQDLAGRYLEEKSESERSRLEEILPVITNYFGIGTQVYDNEASKGGGIISLPKIRPPRLPKAL